MVNLNGLVINEKNAGESGKSIRLLTKESACIDVYVRGGQKSKKSLSSTQLFCYAAFSLEHKRDVHGIDRYYYNSSEPIKLFYGIRLDVKKMALASYFSEILTYTSITGENTENVCRLALNTLYFLDKGTRSEELLKSIFEFRLLCETGYRPNLIGCCHCYAVEDDLMHFNFKTGLIECDNCVRNKNDFYDFTFDRMLFHIVRYIALVDYDKLFNFRISDSYQKKLTKFTETFSEYYYGKKFNSLKFYRAL